MKFSTIISTLSLIANTSAFTAVTQGRNNVPTYLNAGDYEPMEGETKINLMIDLDNPKVANMEEVAPGGKKVFCRCWLSGTFPLCDGTHVKHNKEVGDNVGPLIVSVAKEE